MIKRREETAKYFLVASLSLLMMVIAACTRKVETAPGQELPQYTASALSENSGGDRVIAKPGEVLIYEITANRTLRYHLFDSDGESVWLQDVVDQQVYEIIDIAFSDGYYYLHSMIDVDKAYLICLDEAGNSLWQEALTAYFAYAHRIAPLSAGGVAVFSTSDDDQLSISRYAPSGERTVIAVPSELQNVSHVYEAASGAGGSIWLRCAYQEGDSEERRLALFLLDSSFRVSQKLLMPSGEWIDGVVFQADTERYIVDGHEWKYATSGGVIKDGFWLVLDKDLRLLHRQDEVKAISGIAGLNEGRFLVFLSLNDEEKADNVFVYSEDFALLESKYDEPYVRIYDSSSGGYYAVEETISQTVTWPLYSSLLPLDMFIRKYDEQNQLCWEKSYFVEADIPYHRFGMVMVKQIASLP